MIQDSISNFLKQPSHTLHLGVTRM